MNCNLFPLVFLLLLSMLWTSFSACLFCLPPCLASIFFFYHQMIALLYLIFYYQSPHEWGASFSSSFLRFLSLCLLFTIDCIFLYSFLCSFTLSLCVCVSIALTLRACSAAAVAAAAEHTEDELAEWKWSENAVAVKEKSKLEFIQIGKQIAAPW